MKLMILLLIISTVGCSYRGAYESLQVSRRYECTKLPPSQYQSCMERASMTYEEYERERNALGNSTLE